jgi:hypothetical protein
MLISFDVTLDTGQDHHRHLSMKYKKWGWKKSNISRHFLISLERSTHWTLPCISNPPRLITTKFRCCSLRCTNHKNEKKRRNAPWFIFLTSWSFRLLVIRERQRKLTKNIGFELVFCMPSDYDIIYSNVWIIIKKIELVNHSLTAESQLNLRTDFPRLADVDRDKMYHKKRHEHRCFLLREVGD